MSDPNAVHRLVTIELSKEFDRIITVLRDSTRTADKQAANGNSLAYQDLTARLGEVHSLAVRSPSEEVGNVLSDVGEGVSGLSAQALSACNLEQLLHLLSVANRAIHSWSPAPQGRLEKPRLVLGDIEDVLAVWEDDAEELRRACQPEREIREEIEAAVSAVLTFLDSARKNLDFRSAAQEELYSIRRQPSGAFLVRFGQEVGTIRGCGADRFVRLCRFKRLNVEYLASEVPEASASQAVSRFHENEGIQTPRSTSLARELGQKAMGNLRQRVKLVIEEKELDLAACESSERREQLKSDLRQLAIFQNGFWRTPDSEIKKQRSTIERSWQRLVTECSTDMPLFSEQIETSWQYDLIWDEYVYRGVEFKPLNF